MQIKTKENSTKKFLLLIFTKLLPLSGKNAALLQQAPAASKYDSVKQWPRRPGSLSKNSTTGIVLFSLKDTQELSTEILHPSNHKRKF